MIKQYQDAVQLENSAKAKRDLYIDTIKGLCVISIIFIHTVFWSGASYVPKIVKTIALFFDVPAFFFLTGCTISIYPNINPIKQMAKLIVLFFLIFLFFQLILGPYSIDVLGPIFLHQGTINLLPVVAGSYWFVPIYVISLIYATMVIKYLKKIIMELILLAIPLFYLILWIIGIKIEYLVLGYPIQLVLFYLWLILLGYKIYQNSFRKYYGIGFVLTSIFGLLFLKINHVNLYLQMYKFPVVQLPYLLASLFSIGFILILKREIKENIIASIGKNAIYFYASQGISSSIIYLLKDIPLAIYIKLPICFVCNCILSLVIGYILYKLFSKYSYILFQEEQKLF